MQKQVYVSARDANEHCKTKGGEEGWKSEDVMETEGADADTR
jgi:hypothetical protein